VKRHSLVVVGASCPSDAGASPAKREWKKAQCTSAHFENNFELKKGISCKHLKRL
jgi:hypothetical protein